VELCVSDKIVAKPSAGDIELAFDGAPHDEDWYLTLDAGDDGFLDVLPDSNGAYKVTASDGKQERRAARPLTADQAKRMALKYLVGDPGWRDQCTWTAGRVAHRDGASASTQSSPPGWAVAIVVGTVAVVIVTVLLLRAFRLDIPFVDSDWFYVGLIAAPMVVLIVVVVLANMLEVRRAAAWVTTAGRIVKSATEASHHKFAGEETTVKTVPVVEYEFSVDGRTARGTRVSIGEDAAADPEATLRRYPVGAAVRVYYDPANPRNCVLERDVPEGFGKGLAILLGMGVVAAAVIYWLATSAPRLLEARFPNGNAPLAIMAAAMGLMVLLFFIAGWRASRKAADWPLVQGTVLSSGVEKVQKRLSGRSQEMYAPAVEYGYRVHDVDYVSRQIKLGASLLGSETYATGVAARYLQGKLIDVHYDPANPANAALENPTGLYWLLLAVALGLFAVAAHAIGVW
jgi:hypothetical protein